MTSFKLSEKLKEAGLSQELKKGDWYYFIGRKGIWLVDFDVRVSTLPKEKCLKAWTVEGLLAELPETFEFIEGDIGTLSLFKFGGGYGAKYDSEDETSTFKSADPAEALGLLKLHMLKL